jgi:hypothetical protein
MLRGCIYMERFCKRGAIFAAAHAELSVNIPCMVRVASAAYFIWRF